MESLTFLASSSVSALFLPLAALELVVPLAVLKFIPGCRCSEVTLATHPAWFM